MKYFITLILMSILSTMVHAAPVTEKPILLVGGSLANGTGPADFPFVTNFGSYRDLGGSLLLKGMLVQNGAQGGAATFDYTTTLFGPPISFDGYQKQFDRITSLVFNFVTLTHNADYIVIAIPNDCLHGAVSVDPCTTAEYNETVDTLISIGQQALALGITPIYDIYMAYDDIDLSGFLALGIPFVIDEAGYNELRTLHMTRIAAEMPLALQVDMWADYVHLGDGLHPDLNTSKKAAIAIKQAITMFEI